MTSEEQQNDMTMEDILSSIKDILENDSQDQAAEAAADKDKAALVATEDVEPSSENIAVADETQSTAEDDVFDLSQAMIIDDASSSTEDKDISAVDVSEAMVNETDMQINFANQEALDSEKETEAFFEENSVATASEDDFSINIENILQTASEAIAEDASVSDMAENSAEDIEALPDISSENISFPENLNSSEIDITSEPIYEEDNSSEEQGAETLLPEKEDIEPIDVEPEPIPDIDIDLSKPLVSEEEITLEPEEIESEQPTTPIVEAINPAASTDVEENYDESEANTTMESEPEKTDVADVSADIINNFAKMFAEQTQAPQQEVVEPKVEPVSETISVSGLGDGSKTIEQVVEGVIQGIVASSVNAEMTKNVDIVSYAQKEIREQTQAWLEANLPEIVKEAVQKEIERVMAKVGK